MFFFFFFQAEDGIRDLVRSRGLGDVYKRQSEHCRDQITPMPAQAPPHGLPVIGQVSPAVAVAPPSTKSRRSSSKLKNPPAATPSATPSQQCKGGCGFFAGGDGFCSKCAESLQLKSNASTGRSTGKSTTGKRRRANNSESNGKKSRAAAVAAEIEMSITVEKSLTVVEASQDARFLLLHARVSLEDVTQGSIAWAVPPEHAGWSHALGAAEAVLRNRGVPWTELGRSDLSCTVPVCVRGSTLGSGTHVHNWEATLSVKRVSPQAGTEAEAVLKGTLHVQLSGEGVANQLQPGQMVSVTTDATGKLHWASRASAQSKLCSVTVCELSQDSQLRLIPSTQHPAAWWHTRVRQPAGLQAVAEDGTVWEFGDAAGCAKLDAVEQHNGVGGGGLCREGLITEIAEAEEAVSCLLDLQKDGFFNACMEKELKESERMLEQLKKQLQDWVPEQKPAPESFGLATDWLRFARHFNVQPGDTVVLSLDELGQLLVAVKHCAKAPTVRLVECVLLHQLEKNDLLGWSLWLPAAVGALLYGSGQQRADEENRSCATWIELNKGTFSWGVQRNEQGFEVMSGWVQFRAAQQGTVARDLIKLYVDNLGQFSVSVEHQAQAIVVNGESMPALPPIERQMSDGSRLGLATTKDAVLINKANANLADLVFMGDSIVAGIPPQLQRQHFQNFGVSGSCVEDVLSLVRSPKFASDCAAQVKVFVLCIGTNNLWKDPVDVVVQKMIQSVRVLCNNYAEMQLVVLGVLPRGDQDFAKTAKQIASFNRQIRYHCRSSLGEVTNRVNFIDIGAKFLDRTGMLIADLYLMDKLHLNADGYCVFMGEIASLVDQLLESPIPTQNETQSAVEPQIKQHMETPIGAVREEVIDSSAVSYTHLTLPTKRIV
eukprot:TRINITY_DN17336_c0_g1_i1.p1 TRINITY_DN17336_c0_g1~~TRINITY_DN17336_c0_g1_i1.p1  ORF type:complete len:885 (-),score=222.31 TRINITY_DN17336_c0_g1_i1:62-2716(-)